LASINPVLACDHSSMTAWIAWVSQSFIKPDPLRSNCSGISSKTHKS
jgi:hypothetical protein